MSNVKIKDKYTYNCWREVNKPSWVGIVPVKLLEYRSLFKNKKMKRKKWTKREKRKERKVEKGIKRKEK